MQSMGSLPRKHILSICSSYSGTSALRHFVIHTDLTGTHSDSVVGTALRRASGASCTRFEDSGRPGSNFDWS